MLEIQEIIKRLNEVRNLCDKRFSINVDDELFEKLENVNHHVCKALDNIL